MLVGIRTLLAYQHPASIPVDTVTDPAPCLVIQPGHIMVIIVTNNLTSFTNWWWLELDVHHACTAQTRCTVWQSRPHHVALLDKSALCSSAVQ